MAKPIRSARGSLVDFDLIRIKQQMESTPKQAPVQARENFIDQRAKRRLNRSSSAIVQSPTVEPVSIDPTPAVDIELTDTQSPVQVDEVSTKSKSPRIKK